MEHADLIIENCGELITVAGASGRPKSGRSLDGVGVIRDGAVAVRRGRIAWAGGSSELREHVSPGRGTKTIDASGKVVMPGFVDCHTHLVFGGSREDEWLRKLGGEGYLEILKENGGILSTVRATRRATADALIKRAMRHLGGMLAHGTTTSEVKSGYGLTIKDEIKILRAVKELGEMQPVGLVPTFMGAHAVPAEFGSAAEYAKFVADRMVPEIARLKLAKYCDVFCEESAFSPSESRVVLESGRLHGLIPRMHSNEFNDIGGTAVARDVRPASIDHLDVLSRSAIADVKASGAIAVLLPGIRFFLGDFAGRSTNGKRLISAGVPIAIATDFNPGTCFCYSIPMMLSLACIQMGLSPEQAINAATINAAHSLGLSDQVGSIEAGKQADLIILGIENHRQLPYWAGMNPVETVVKAGRIASSAPAMPNRR